MEGVREPVYKGFGPLSQGYSHGLQSPTELQVPSTPALFEISLSNTVHCQAFGQSRYIYFIFDPASYHLLYSCIQVYRTTLKKVLYKSWLIKPPINLADGRN